MAWYSLTIDVAEADAELLGDLLHEAGASGLELRDGTVPLMPGVRAPAKGETVVVAWFEGKAVARKAQAAVQEHHPAARMKLDAVQERDWSTEWRALIRPVTVGRLWVGPPWAAAEAPPGKVQLVIEPKMAFGTGDHPTTMLCLQAVDAYLGEHPSASVLDVGTGTGVLALAAKKLGAGKVVGTDNDPVAVELAKEAAALNGVAGLDFSTRTLPGVKGRFDLVVANILANTLVDLAPLLAPKVKDRLVLAGVLAPQRDEVEAAYAAQGLRPLAGAREGEWVRLDFEAP